MKQSYFSTDPRYKPYSFKGLKGRYMHMPAASERAKRTFVMVYGQHATLERIGSIAEAFTDYGDVYAADNPGFGGMDPAYKISRYPDLGFYAEHLRHFLTEYVPRDRKVTLVGISYGFQMVTEMLQRYPELHSRIEQAVSFVGFIHYQDFRAPVPYSVRFLRLMSNVGRSSIGAKICSPFLREPAVVTIYRVTKPIQVKFKSLPKEDAKRYAKEQAWLWRINDGRTHAATAWDFFTKNDLTSYRIDVPAVHIGVPHDHFFDNERINAELESMYRSLTVFELALENHAPLDIDTPDKVRELLPPKLKKLIRMSANDGAVRE